MTDWRLRESTQGKLALFQCETLVADQVMPVLAFPFSAPEESISIVDEYSKEMAWIDRMDQLDADSQAAVKAYLALREFRPKVLRITSVSTYSTPSIWMLETDRGPCKFELPSDESIRRLAGNSLVLTHANGMQFIIDDLFALDARSRQILARFMA
ncbi:cyanophycin metabolism-associated DUF1854 family protein [Limnobacter parvus]|uniref:DUF1854 domain-containing protein n=1 Tax=Limnobacter parvus TaxID=2939690 RepID=A0ABT1XHU6_9BURK|nr:DUF1854 domain-containing protein [Limnobacter parvus]MCR2746850.1 DUF1854 domain-containing protein [Limnobacter parvus]